MNTVSVPASLDSAPGDIFSEIMCYIDGTTLANWTRVSKRWGDLILDHPVYWGQLELTEVSDGSSALFLKRMSHSRGRTITVLVMTRQYDDPSRSIFSAIGENMGHISSLTLICPLSQPIFELIAQPAPLLHTLHLKSTTGLVFPKPETFQFSAPRLRIVNLINIAAPPGPVAALSNTQSLTCGLSRSYRWWSNGSVFRWAQAATPQLQSLAVFMFNASASALSDDNWEALEGWLAQLSKLTIEVDTPFVAAPQLFLPRMSCIQSPISTVAISAVVTHLHEAEWLSVSATAERAEVACACRRRSVAFGPGPSGPSKSSVGISFFIGSKLADPTLPTAPSGRISSIELALDIWNDLALTHSRGQFHLLDTLTLTLHEGSLDGLQRMLTFCKARRLKLVNRSSIQPILMLERAELDLFVATILCAVTLPLAVYLEGIEVYGSSLYLDSPVNLLEGM